MHFVRVTSWTLLRGWRFGSCDFVDRSFATNVRSTKSHEITPNCTKRTPN